MAKKTNVKQESYEMRAAALGASNERLLCRRTGFELTRCAYENKCNFVAPSIWVIHSSSSSQSLRGISIQVVTFVRIAPRWSNLEADICDHKTQIISRLRLLTLSVLLRSFGLSYVLTRVLNLSSRDEKKKISRRTFFHRKRWTRKTRT